MSSKNKNVFIHIGLHKTGTTAIQFALQQLQNSGELSKVGFQAHTDSTHHIAFDYMFFRDKIDEVILRLYEEMRRYTLNEKEELQKNIILSSETFSLEIFENDFSVSDVLAPFFCKALKDYNVKIIVYLRRQDSYLESFYAQKAKYGALSEEMFFNRKIKCSLFYKKILDGYAKFFGKENILVRVYDKELLYKNDIVYDFFNTVGLDENLISKLKNNKINESFSPEGLRIRFFFDNQYKLDDKCRERYIQCIENDYKDSKISFNEYALRMHCTCTSIDYKHTYKYNCLYDLFTLEKTGSFSNSGFMHPEERRDFLAQYEEDNAAVAREYLGREDGKLFNDNYPTNIISLEEINAKDVITIFVPIVQHYHEKFKEAECRFETIERRLGYIIRPWKIIPVIFRRILKLIM